MNFIKPAKEPLDDGSDNFNTRAEKKHERIEKVDQGIFFCKERGGREMEGRAGGQGPPELENGRFFLPSSYYL